MNKELDMRAPLGEAWRYTWRHPVVRRALTVFAVSALLSIGAMLYALPEWRESHAIESVLAARNEQTALDRNRDALVLAVREASINVEEIEKKLSARDVQTTLVNQLNQIARRDGVRILDSAYHDRGSDGDNRPWLHELTAEGDYAALRRFIGDLGTLPTLTVVREASLTTAAGNGRRITARLRLATYHHAGGGR
jgi:hypothetical protein